MNNNLAIRGAPSHKAERATVAAEEAGRAGHDEHAAALSSVHYRYALRTESSPSTTV